MGAEVPIFVKVVRTFEEWIEVSAVTLQEADEKAMQCERVIDVLDHSYERPFPFDSIAHKAGASNGD